MRNSGIRNNQLTASSGEPGSSSHGSFLACEMMMMNRVLCVVWMIRIGRSQDDTPTRFSVLDLSECCFQHEHLDNAGAVHAN